MTIVIKMKMFKEFNFILILVYLLKIDLKNLQILFMQNFTKLAKRNV